MKKGTIIKGPAIIRRLYHGQWEYSLLLPIDGNFCPFGHSPPRCVKWVYQVTWKDKLQRIHTVTPADLKSLDDGLVKEHEFWWNNPKQNSSLRERSALKQALAAHSVCYAASS